MTSTSWRAALPAGIDALNATSCCVLASGSAPANKVSCGLANMGCPPAAMRGARSVSPSAIIANTAPIMVRERWICGRRRPAARMAIVSLSRQMRLAASEHPSAHAIGIASEITCGNARRTRIPRRSGDIPDRPAPPSSCCSCRSMIMTVAIRRLRINGRRASRST